MQVCKVEVGPVRTGLELALPLHFASHTPDNSGGGLQEGANTQAEFPKGGLEIKLGFKPRQPTDKVEWASDL